MDADIADPLSEQELMKREDGFGTVFNMDDLEEALASSSSSDGSFVSQYSDAGSDGEP